jgi:hypothetical protein
MTIDKTEFESILKNEQSDLKGNLKAQANQGGLFPAYGPVNYAYTVLILFNQIIIAFKLPIQLSFWNDEKESQYMLIYDLFLDALFFVDILIKFRTPVYSESRLITDGWQIAKKYIQSYFFIDLVLCFPLSYFLYASYDRPRSTDDWNNFKTLNLRSLPRFLPMMFICKMIRCRTIIPNLRKVVKKFTWIRVQVQDILITLFKLVFCMNFFACLLKSSANFNINDE